LAGGWTKAAPAQKSLTRPFRSQSPYRVGSGPCGPPTSGGKGGGGAAGLGVAAWAAPGCGAGAGVPAGLLAGVSGLSCIGWGFLWGSRTEAAALCSTRQRAFAELGLRLSLSISA